MKDTVKRLFGITPELDHELNDLKDTEGRDRSWVVRDALHMWLKANGREVERRQVNIGGNRKGEKAK